METDGTPSAPKGDTERRNRFADAINRQGFAFQSAVLTAACSAFDKGNCLGD